MRTARWTAIALAILISPTRGAITGVPTGTAGFVGLAMQGDLNLPTPIGSMNEFIQAFGNGDPSLTNPYLLPSVAAFFANGGARCFIVRVAKDTDSSYIGSDGPGGGTGLHALRGIEEVAIVCIPGVTSHEVQAALIAHCEERGSRFAILDPIPGATPEAILGQRQGLLSVEGYGALYYPWLQATVDGAEAALPPSGFVAGLYARTDRDVGVWKAPAGNVLSATGLERNLTDQERDSLNTAGISTIRLFPGNGILLWGARTIADDPEYRYVSVRRFMIFLRRSIEEGTRYAVFEPNDEPLWARLRSEVEDFLLALWRDGALLGATPNDAFFVHVDQTTMTQGDIDAGRTVILLGVAPLRPAEILLLRVVIERPPAAPPFLRGDPNGDGGFDISDAIEILGFLFLGRARPACLAAADMDGGGTVDISDAVFGLSFLFLGGPAPAEPFRACGIDASGEASLGCQAPADC